jgi:hypothetical protein
MRYAPRVLAGGWVAAAGLFATACGSSAPGLLSSQQAAQLNAALDRISARFSHHHCTAAQNQAANLRRRVEQLPASVNRNVRQSLQQGALTVEQYVAQDCIQQPTPAAPAPPVTTSTHTTPPPPPKTTGTTTNPNATPPPNPGTKPKGHGHGPKAHGGD